MRGLNDVHIPKIPEAIGLLGVMDEYEWVCVDYFKMLFFLLALNFLPRSFFLDKKRTKKSRLLIPFGCIARDSFDCPINGLYVY